MNTNRRFASVSTPFLGALIAATLLIGCSNYYRVTDASNGTVYYTKSIDKNRSGAVEFTDARTRNKVTLQNSSVAEISEKDFKTAVGK